MRPSLAAGGVRCCYLVLLAACFLSQAEGLACEESGMCSIGLTTPFVGEVQSSECRRPSPRHMATRSSAAALPAHLAPWMHSWMLSGRVLIAIRSDAGPEMAGAAARCNSRRPDAERR